jgi:hypothetical protein|tara:strand:- start:617 stop:1171 length:555 start_codon:yes stop_codon:yes gene_type:complete
MTNNKKELKREGIKKMIFRYAWFLIVLILIGYIGGTKSAICFFIALIGIIVGLKKGYFKEIAVENFTLHDYEGRTRAVIGGQTPPENHVIGQDWDPSPGIDLFYRNGVKGLSLALDWYKGNETSSMMLFNKEGKTKIAMLNNKSFQTLMVENLDIGKNLTLCFEGDKDKLYATDEKGETIWSAK